MPLFRLRAIRGEKSVKARIEDGDHPHLGSVCRVKVGASLYGMFYGPKRREQAEARRDELGKLAPDR